MLLLTLAASPLAACKGTASDGSSRTGVTRRETSTVADTDPVALAKLIRLPFPPKSVRWETVERAAGTDWALTALITGDPAQVQALVKASPARSSTGASIAKAHAPWFPADVISRRQRSGSGTAERVAVEAVRMDVAPFVDPQRSPLTNGTAVVFEEEGLVYLSLFTM